MASSTPPPDWQALDAEAHKAILELRGVGTDQASPEVIGLALQAGTYLAVRQRGGVFVPTKTILGAFAALGTGMVAGVAGLWQKLTG